MTGLVLSAIWGGYCYTKYGNQELNCAISCGRYLYFGFTIPSGSLEDSNNNSDLALTVFLIENLSQPFDLFVHRLQERQLSWTQQQCLNCKIPKVVSYNGFRRWEIENIQLSRPSCWGKRLPCWNWNEAKIHACSMDLR